jgi:hypothetical protein
MFWLCDKMEISVVHEDVMELLGLYLNCYESTGAHCYYSYLGCGAMQVGTSDLNKHLFLVANES